MRRGLEAADKAAPTTWYKTLRIDELVNDAGDGGTPHPGELKVTYLLHHGGLPASSIDTIEKAAKTRITRCPEHEAPSSRQAWRTARD